MKFSLVTLLALTGLAAAASRNCRQYDAVFTSCIRRNVTASGGGLLDDLKYTTNVDLRTQDRTNACFGGDGMVYVGKEYSMINNEVGPPNSRCDDSSFKYETKIKIYRWRNKWDKCEKIDDHMRSAVSYRDGVKFWYTNTIGGQVKCEPGLPIASGLVVVSSKGGGVPNQ